MTGDTAETIPLRTRLGIYGSGLFSDGATNVVVPLWALYLEPSPFAFGLVIGARSLLPFLFSIHGGVLMDRFGARQVMLYFSAIGLIVPILFPLLPWIWVAGILNLILGLSSTMNWVGAQTVVGQVMRGDASLTWQVSFCNRLGHLAFPVLAGAMWDVFGPWGGFGVTLIAAVLFIASALLLPRRESEPNEEKDSGPLRLREMLPRLDDYTKTFSLLAIPLVAVGVAGSVLNIAGSAIHGSFFIAYMKDVGLTGTLIGVIFAGLNLAGLAGTAGATRIARYTGDIWLLNATVVGAIATIVVTPFFAVFLSLLALSIVRGINVGISQPLMIVIPAKAAPPGAQGAVVGLRISINRLMQTVVPPIMGGVVALVGLENSFYWVGGFLMLLSCGLWAIFRPPNSSQQGWERR